MLQPNENAGKVLTSPASGATLLIIVQVASRLFTFIANQLILRNLSPAILGIAAQLELFSISILYFSRESIRIAIQRQPLELTPDAVARERKGANSPCEKRSEPAETQTIASQSVVNMSYLGIGMGFPLAISFATFYIHFASEQVSQAQYYRLSVVITTAASLIELCTEPFFAIVQQYMLYKKRAGVEMTAAFVKSLAVCSSVAWAAYNGRNIGVLPFALGYLCYSLALICGYSVAILNSTRQRRFSLLLKQLSFKDDDSTYIASRFPRRLVLLCANVYFQSIVKHLLTQGDSMILAAMTSLEDQGTYSLASNYGGLVARVLFQPIEESSRSQFSSMMNYGKPGEQATNNISAAKAHLIEVLRSYSMLSVLIIPLGPYLIPRALHVLGGRKWASSDIDSLLSLYCYYIPFLAFNGITEAFVSSAASPSDLRRQAGWMGAFSGVFALAAFLFLKIGGLGAHGLVWVNVVNMGVRITWSSSFVRSYLEKYSNSIALSDFGPRPYTLMAATIASVIFAGRNHASVDFNSIVRGFAVGAAYGLLVLYLERAYFITQYKKARQVFKNKSMRPKT